MAVSHKYKFIFIHIPKCAGSSIEKSLGTFGKLTLMSKVKYIFDENESNLMNFIGRLENLTEDFEHIISQIDISRNYDFKTILSSGFKRLLPFLPLKSDTIPNLPHVNKSNSQDYREYYDEQLRKKVELACEKDLQFFNYDF